MNAPSTRTTSRVTRSGDDGSGTTPYTRLANNPMICGRRWFIHCAAVVTGVPSAVTSKGGKW